MKTLKSKLEKACSEEDIEWINGLRKELGLDKIGSPWYDRVKEILAKSGEELRHMSYDSLNSHYDALAGWHLFLKDKLGQARAARKIQAGDFDVEINSKMAKVRGGSADERRSVVLWDEPSLMEVQRRINQLDALIEQTDSTLWGVESKMKSIDNYIMKKRFENQKNNY
tara:strand:- start:967 stop:1473 length:507 start_codon:yes stop_codon:yes gene_type:complete